MDRSWISFAWDVPADGFHWLFGRSTKEGRTSKLTLFLTRVTTYTDSFLNRRYDAPQVPRSLFRTFADVPLTQEGVLEFANEYGSLGPGEPFQLKVSGTIMVGQPLVGEPIDLWQEQIATMNQLTALWDLCRQKDLATLTRHIRWQTDKHGHPAVHYDSHPDLGKSSKNEEQRRVQTVIAAHDHHPEWLSQWSPGDLILPALFYLADEINQQMHIREGMRLAWISDDKCLALRFPVPSLRDFLWALFAEAVATERSFRKCKTCGTWFELSPILARTNRRFCSEGCRSRCYRNKQEEARRLHEAGKSVAEIARLVDSDVATVKGWVGKSRG